MEGLTFHDEPSGYIMAPNGAYWQHHGTYDMDSLTQAQGEVSHAAGSTAVDCAAQWTATQALWLRQYNDGNGGDYFQDEYDEGPTEGPTCFTFDDGAEVRAYLTEVQAAQ